MRFDLAQPQHCDRCGRPEHPEFLKHDGIGDVCLQCRVRPAEEATQHA